MNDLTDEDMERFEEQLEDTSLKALLWEQNALLRAIYDELTAGESTEVDTYECDTCGEVVTNREQHLKQSHKLPHGTDLKIEDFFEEV